MDTEKNSANGVSTASRAGLRNRFIRALAKLSGQQLKDAGDAMAELHALSKTRAALSTDRAGA